MKASIYNYIFNDERYSYWFQGLHRTFFILEQDLSKKIEEYISTSSKIEILKEFLPHFYENLVNKGFLICKSINELDIVEKKRKESINSKDYFLIILPTLNCNFNCWYCIQDHIPSIMSASTIDKVKKHIKQKVEKDKITSLHVEWFGGEPFMYFDKVIKPISEYALHICEESNIDFINTSTTNGFFLKKELHLDLINLKFSRFHITLDGNRDTHNSIKFQKNNYSAFDTTLDNISQLLALDSGIKILLRINYTKENLHSSIVRQVNKHIKNEHRNKVKIALKKVWQEEMNKNIQFRLYELMDEFQKSGYNVQRLEIISNFLTCYVEKKYYNAINFNGTIVKCTAHDDLYSNNPPGHLNKAGDIIWREGVKKDFRSRIQKECLSCKYLPICIGVCPRDYNKEGDGVFRCKLKYLDMSIDKMIINHIKGQYK